MKIIARKSPAVKAAKHTAAALAGFDAIVSGLNEANRLLEVEQAEAWDAHTAHHTLADDHRAIARAHADRAFRAQDDHVRNTRVAERVAALVL